MGWVRYATAAVLLAALWSAPFAPQAATLEEQRQEGLLVKSVEQTNAACGTRIPVSFDWRNAPQDRLSSYSAASYCDNMLFGVRHICDDPAGKKAVVRKIKSISCGFGGKRTMSLKNGALDYKINFNSSNDGDYAYEYLQNHL